MVSAMWTASVFKLDFFQYEERPMKWRHEKNKASTLFPRTLTDRRIKETIVFPMIVFHKVWISCWLWLPSPSSWWSKRRIDRAVARKTIMTEAMSMTNILLRQSIHGWVLFLGIIRMFMMAINSKYERNDWGKCLGLPVTSYGPGCFKQTPPTNTVNWLLSLLSQSALGEFTMDEENKTWDINFTSRYCPVSLRIILSQGLVQITSDKFEHATFWICVWG